MKWIGRVDGKRKVEAVRSNNYMVRKDMNGVGISNASEMGHLACWCSLLIMCIAILHPCITTHIHGHHNKSIYQQAGKEE